MPLMPAYLPTESESLLCAHLASRAATLLANPASARDDQISLQNIFRLLEMYRFDTFLDVTPKGVLELGEGPSSAEAVLAEGELLKLALDAASASAFPGATKAKVVEMLEALISQIAMGSGSDQDAITQAKRFFEELARACGPSRRQPHDQPRPA